MFEKEIEKIKAPIRDFITSKLLDGFKNRKHQEVVRIEFFHLLECNINEEKTELKENAQVDNVIANARVWVKIDNDGSETNNDLNLRIAKSIFLDYDPESKEYKILNIDDLNILDMTN